MQIITGALADSDVFIHIPEALEENYQVIYELEPPENGGFQGATSIPYTVDNSNTAPDFDRVAYYLELTDSNGTHWVYASMDTFTGNAGELGLPHNIDNPVTHRRPVHNLHIASNVPGVVTGTFFGGGHIEMWPGDYCSDDTYGVFAASDTLYDWGDCVTSTGPGYGTFQVHNTVARQTVLAYNRWGLDDGHDDDIGIGSQPGGEPDWTYAGNAADYSSRKLVILVRPRTYDVAFTDLPRDRQLYSRNVATNLATIPITGHETFGGYQRIVLRTFRNDILQTETDQALTYSGGVAPFSFAPQIPAELAKYDFQLLLDDGSRLKPVERVRDVVAGDAFLVYGQSNAEASDWDPNRSANEYASDWLLTFGQNGDSGMDAENILLWVKAEGDGDRHGPGAIGQWPMVLGRRIIDTYGIPVAILNGSRSSYSIRRLQKDRDDPDNLYDSDDVTRTYNRLRYRAIQAGIAETARALFYYQGESDNDKEDRHADGYQSLRADWADDFPGIERFYVTQVRPGCGVTAASVRLRDAQRRFADLYPRTSVMSTNGLDNHDGCHFLFTAGYEDLGWHYFRLTARDLYNAPDTPNIDAPNPALVGFTDSTQTELRLTLRTPATINFPTDALEDFNLEGSSASVISRTVEDNAILLQLSDPVAPGTVLEYRSHLGSGDWVTNANGVGLLSFAEPITAISAAPSGTQLTGVDLLRPADGVAAATLTVQLRDEAGTPLTDPDVSVVFKTTLGFFPNGHSTSDPVLTDTDGQAEVSLVSTTSGQASVTATINGASIANGVPLAVSFVPGDISFAESGTLLGGENLYPVADGTDAALLTVQLRDEFGNDILQPGIAVDFASTLGQFSDGSAATTVSTDETGLATVSLSSKISGVADVTANINGQTVTNGSPIKVEFTTGPAALLSLDVQPEGGTSGELLPSQPVVTIRDAHGNLVSNDNGTQVEVTIFSGTNGILGGTTTRTATNGFVLFDDLSLAGTVSESYVFNFSDTTENLVPVQSVNIQIAPASAEVLIFTTTGQTITAGAASEPITVQLRDVYGNVAIRDQTTTLTLSSSLPGSFRDADDTTEITTLEIPAGESTTSFRYTATVAGDHLVTAEAPPETTLPSASQELTVTADAPVEIAFTTPARTITADSLSELLTVQLQDAHGNPATRVETTSLTLASNLPGIFRDADETTDITALEIPAGESTTSFRYTATVAGTHLLTAEAPPETTLPSASQELTVTADAPVEIAFTTPARTITAGNLSELLTVQLQDAYNNPATRAEATSLTLSSNLPGIFRDADETTDITALEIPASESTTSFRYTATVAGTHLLTAEAPPETTLPSASQELTVTADAPVEIAFTTPARTITADSLSELLTVQLQDAHGNPATRVETTSLTLASNLPGIFRDADETTDITALEIPAGESTTSFRYTATVAGTHLLTAEAPPETTLPSASQELTVTADAPVEIAFTTPARTITAGNLSELLTVQLQDAYNNAATRAEATSLTLSSNLPGTFRDADDTTDIAELGIPVGESTVSFRYTATVAGNHLLAAEALPETTRASATQELGVLPGAAARLTFQQQPTNTVINEVFVPAVLVRIEDEHGNPLADSSDQVTLAIENNPGNGTLSGSYTNVSTVTGIASFADLRIDTIAAGYALTATSASGLAAAISDPFDITPGAGFASWAEELPDGQRDEMDDPGGHGISNILRYAFGMSPSNPDRNRLPQLELVGPQSERRLSITYTRRLDDPTLTYTVEAAGSLLDWTSLDSADTTIEQTGPATEIITVTDTETIPGINKRFLRVIVSW